MKIITQLKDMVWGIPTLLLLLIFGIYFTRKSGFYRPSAMKITVRSIISSLKASSSKGISSFSAVATALGGTVGIGSIAGVGYGIAVGGAGSIFWMWVCSFFGMGLKYAEVRIALNKRTETKDGSFGGAPFRLKEQGYGGLAILFCLICIACSFGTGNLTQIGSVSSVLASSGVSKLVCGITSAFVVGAAVFGGRSRIATLNSVLIPTASAVYLLACISILVMNRGNLPRVFQDIFTSAMGIDSIKGGFSGAMLSMVLKEGFARSLFSNEAGMGSSPLAHATAETENPEIQAHWGIFEIFFDTFAVSSLTALCLLSCNVTDTGKMFSAFFGKAGELSFLALMAVFAFASVISWCYYAECCISFLFPESRVASMVYRLIFALAAFLGGYVSVNVLWELADILNAMMMFPNLFLLYKCRNEIERIA